MRSGLPILVIAAMVAAGGCKIEAGDGEIAAGFSWTWTVIDSEANELSCEEAGAAYTRITITDADDVTHTLYWECESMAGETSSWEIATGAATVTADLVTESDKVLSTVTFDFTFESGELSNEFDPVEFEVETVWDPKANATGSVFWQWGVDLDDDGVMADDGSEYMTSELCDGTFHIDYVRLWVWNPVAEVWWWDDTIDDEICEAEEKPDGYTYSGLYYEDYLAPGTYQFFLGFYKEAEGEDSSDILLYYDTRGTSDDGLSGEILDDDETADGWNDLGVTFLVAEDWQFGVLKIKLNWHQSDGSDYASCADSNVQKMGFLLRSDGWVAAEVPLSEGIECLDWLNFTEVPVLDEAYELLVSGISKEDEFLWYYLCTGLVPETDVDLESAEGYTCEIEHAFE